MSWAKSLIKLSTYEVETLQKRLAEIADQRQQVEMRLAMLHAEGQAEQAAAAQDPQNGWRIVGYMEGLRARMDRVRKDLHLKYPRAETPTHYIAMGFDDDLAIAARKAVREMVDFLVAAKGLSRDDAYMLVSVAGDLDVTEVVDRNKAMHVMLPKAIFAK